MKVLLNGLPIRQFGVYHGRGFEWETIPIENISKIEVIRGAASVEYGDMLSGVVNIITKSGVENPKTTLFGSYGRFHDWKGSFNTAALKNLLIGFLVGDIEIETNILEIKI